MARAKTPYLIIPIFIPFGGCEYQCVFCDQPKITGSAGLPSSLEIKETIEKYLATWKKGGRKEVAFYGGTFTGFPLEVQESFLLAAYGYVASGALDSIRVSTRPDSIDAKTIELLKRYRVEVVELGVQSMDDKVLHLSGRGHGAVETVRSAALLKEAGIKVGIQLMPGLPGDSRETTVKSARSVAALRPDFVRIYPTLVIRDTPLHEIFMRGEYTPWSIEEMTDACKELCRIFKESSIKIIRIGLQPSRELEENIVAGPYHPSFRQLVEDEESAA